MKKAMIFIGNGFDVAYGYNTKYSDFYQSGELKSLADKGNVLCQNILKNIKGDNWADLETGLYHYSLELTKQNGVGNKDIANRFETEFKQLREALFYYIKRELEKIVEANSYLNTTLTEWKNLDYQVLSFNYTQNIIGNISNGRECYNQNDSVNTDKLIYRHGQIFNTMFGEKHVSDDLVLGIDEKQKVENLHSFLYKTSQKVVYKTHKLNDDISSKDGYIIYGCSIGDSDISYFDMIFNPNISGKSYIIYYYKDSTEIKNKIRNLTGDLFQFEKNNNVVYIDCSDQDMDIITKNAITNF